MGEFEKKYTKKQFEELDDKTQKIILDSLEIKGYTEQIEMVSKIKNNLQLLLGILKEHPEYDIDLRKRLPKYLYDRIVMNQIINK